MPPKVNKSTRSKAPGKSSSRKTREPVREPTPDPSPVNSDNEEENQNDYEEDNNEQEDQDQLADEISDLELDEIIDDPDNSDEEVEEEEVVVKPSAKSSKSSKSSNSRQKSDRSAGLPKTAAQGDSSTTNTSTKPSKKNTSGTKSNSVQNNAIEPENLVHESRKSRVKSTESKKDVVSRIDDQFNTNEHFGTDDQFRVDEWSATDRNFGNSQFRSTGQHLRHSRHPRANKPQQRYRYDEYPTGSIENFNDIDPSTPFNKISIIDAIRLLRRRACEHSNPELKWRMEEALEVLSFRRPQQRQRSYGKTAYSGTGSKTNARRVTGSKTPYNNKPWSNKRSAFMDDVPEDNSNSSYTPSHSNQPNSYGFDEYDE